MWPYWLMFLVPAAAALADDKRRGRSATDWPSKWTLGWLTATLALILLVGYRFEIGADWFSYLDFVKSLAGQPLSEIWNLSDPGYMVLNWLSITLGWELVGVNLIGAAIFSVGLTSFCREMPRPWLTLAVATPYLVIVVAMGYSRQGIALSLAMLGLVALQRQSILRFVGWILVAATFHKTAVLLLPIAALASTKNRYWTLAWIAASSAAGYFLFLADSIDGLYESYVEAEYQSEGATLRLAMNAVPAAMLLIWSRRFSLTSAQLALWRWFAIFSFVLLAALFASSASTAVDRMALYLLPLQLVVFSHLPDAISPRRTSVHKVVVLLILLYYALVLGVWLFWATHAKFWLPYRFYPIEILL